MTGHYALLSIVYMMSFVFLFDRLHHRHKLVAWLRGHLMDREELERIQAIWAACQES